MSKHGQTAAGSAAQDPEKQQRVQKELDNLAELFQEIDENKRDFVQRQIEQLAWYFVSIADLQARIDKWGTMIRYSNGGGQEGWRANPDVKTLLDYQKATNTIVRTLIPLVPSKFSGGKLADFLNDNDLDLENV